MKLPVIDKSEVVPVRFIPFITHGDYGRLVIAEILAHELKVCSSRQDEHIVVAIAKMKECRGQKDKQDAGITPMDEILSGDCEEEPYPSLNWEEPHAYRLNDDGVPERIPIAEWRTVCLKIEPIKNLAESEEDKIGIEGAMREKWHVATLEKIPDDAFMWKADLEKICPADKLNYKVFIEKPYKAIVQQAFDNLLAATKKTEIGNKESQRAINSLRKMLFAMAKHGYLYDPKAKHKGKNNGDSLKSMQEDFAKEGFYPSDGTIRTHLEEGAKLINELNHK